ncbi:MAG: type II secretion system protein GspM [Burkholderiaceae bacterium]|nr:type II secretion system protein GspM [Burkholderiaceae bacterium]
MMETLQSYWRQMKPHEKRLLLAASALVLLALLWWSALAPALKTLRLAPEQHRLLDAQIQAMQRMSTEAKALQNQPKLGLEEAQKALQSSVTQRFGNTAQLSIAGERATLTLKNANPQELALWLTQARVNARALPSEVKLNRSATASPSASSSGWDGSLVMNLPRK